MSTVTTVDVVDTAMAVCVTALQLVLMPNQSAYCKRTEKSVAVDAREKVVVPAAFHRIEIPVFAG